MWPEDLMPKEEPEPYTLPNLIYATLEKAKLQVQKTDQCLPGISDQRVAPKGNGTPGVGEKFYILTSGVVTQLSMCVQRAQARGKILYINHMSTKLT